ncbi:MAG: DUF4011 domain-containing protein [Candidatus Bathyarchaeota archaeon]|nr:DUF4011 domain-containing protein [Candidatus Bathyarchaeota archaeon]
MASLSRVRRRVEDWRLKLIDLSRRNRLIYFRPTKRSNIHIERPSMGAIFERLVIKGRSWGIWQPPLAEAAVRARAVSRIRPSRPKRTQLVTAETDVLQLKRTLRNLYRRSASEYRERGVRILYITFGMLNWREASSSEAIRSPIVLTPIELVKETPRDPHRIQLPSVEEEAILNPALRLKIQYDFKIDLPPLPDFEEQNLPEYLEAVAEAGGELDWSVEPVVQIGLFSFHKLVMYQDLSDNIDLIARHPIISALVGVPQAPLVMDPLPTEQELDEIVDLRRTFQVLDADSSQQLCIQYALLGQSFVMHGPPGTGKSQTIANIISEFIAAGRSVLFASEKMAALDVVYNRLKENGLDDFCLELHSHKANKREVVAELSRSLTEHLKPRRAISDAELERLKTRRNQLNSYVTALHRRRSPSETTAFELLGELARLEGIPSVPSEYPWFASLDQKKLFELEEFVRRLTNAWSVVEEGKRFPWRGCTDTRFTPETRSEWIALLDGACGTIQLLTDESPRYAEALGLPHPRTLADYDWLKEASNLISASPRPPASWFEHANLGEIEAEGERNRNEFAEYWATRRALERFYDDRFFILPLGTAERVEGAWARVKELLTPVSEGAGGLLRQMSELAAYVEDLPKKVEEWKEEAAHLSHILGLTGEVDTIWRVQQLGELAHLCGEKDRPEAAWLNRRTLQETQRIFEEAREDHRHRDELRRRLLEAYHEELLTLDLRQLTEWFKGPGRSVFRYLRPSYYRIRSILSNIHRSGRMPETALKDLMAARELVAVEEKMASRREAVRRSLKTYFRDDEPDFASAERALKMAERALRIAGIARAPKEMVENLSRGSKPRKELQRLGRRLRDSLAEWRSATKKLRQMIPTRRLPMTRRSLRRSPLRGVSDWAAEVVERLASLSRISGEVLAARKSDHPSTFKELLLDLKKAETLQSFEATLAERSEELQTMFGRCFTGPTTDWDVILRSIEWTRRLRRLLNDDIPPALIESVQEDGPPSPPDPEVGPKLARLYEAIDGIDSRFEAPLWSDARQLLELDDIWRRLGELLSRVDELQTWVDFKDLEAKLGEAGMGGFLTSLIRRGLDRAQLIDTFHKSMYQGLMELIFEEDSTLKEFRGQDHEQLIADFQELDRRFIQLSAYRVIEIANKQKPQGVFVQAPDSEITILQREAVKKRRHMPLRHLFDRIPNLLRRLKPCLLMSPISVSQFLIPGRLHFDLVVFDEASQIYTEDAVGAIYRGDRLIVAGDNKQLPPTAFFQHSLDDDFDWDESTEYEFDVFDSVLDECMVIGLPVNMLRWHYRSKHDSLINFSNDRFYDRRLVLFPAARKRDEALGLKFFYVPDGVYDRGGARNNPREAEAVADLVFDHFSKHPEKTLGVVTFSISQMNTIQDAVERRLSERPDYQRSFVEDRLHGFFVKNLENVQGDERDVMIFSVGYGYDEDGRITMNFGPLNKQGGERRLNVAITRAREKVILVSSIKAEDINLKATKAPGAQHLCHYIRYAEKGAEALGFEEATGVEFGSPLERDVAKEVKRLGYTIVPRVGCSSFRVDIGVVDPKDPDRFILGILCDGETYRSASTARDRDRLRQHVMENLGWRIHRVWSPDWVQRRETELTRLKEGLTKAERGPRKRRAQRATHRASKRRPRREVMRARVVETRGDRLPEVEPYRLSKLRPRHLFSRYSPEFKKRYLRQYRSEVRRLLPILVRGEGPIHMEHALKRINASLRLRRALPLFKKAFEDAIDDCSKKGRVLVRGRFLWPRRSVDVKVRTPVNGVEETFRPIRNIPPEEIRGAITIIAGHSLGLNVESLLKETAHLLGFKRMGSHVRAALTEVFQSLMREGALIQRDGYVMRSDRM